MSAVNALFEMLEASARREELELPSKEFIATFSKLYKKELAVVDAIGILAGFILLFLGVTDIGIFILALCACLLLYLPTIFSYKCLVNKTIMREEYFLLFFKRRREILWSDVKYKKVKLNGRKSIKLYDANQKCLIEFDELVVGFEHIIKLAKRDYIEKYKKD